MTPTTSATTPERARCTSGTETARCARSIPRQATLRAISRLPRIRNPSRWRRAGRGFSSTCLRRATSRWWIAQNTRLSRFGAFPARNPIIRWRSMSRAGGCSSEHAGPRCCSYTTSIPERSWRSSRSGRTRTIFSSTRSASESTSSAERGGSTSYASRIRIVTRWRARSAGDSKELQAVAQALGRSKLSLLAGIRQASQGSARAISAKFELEDGKLSLSVYTAEKGLAVPAEKNVLQELSGSPEQDKWTPKVEVFKDVPHVARSAEQLAVMSLGRKSLAAVIAEVRKTHPGTVFSVTPVIRNHKPVAVVLVAQKGKVTTVTQPL